VKSDELVGIRLGFQEKTNSRSATIVGLAVILAIAVAGFAVSRKGKKP